MGLIGPVARAAGVDIDCRRDHPYAAYDRVEFDVITARRTATSGRAWWCGCQEVFESIRIIRQCLDKMEPGPLQLDDHGRAAGRPHRGVLRRGAARREPPLRRHRREQPAAALARARPHLPEPAGHPGHDQGPAARRHDHLAGQHRPLLLLHRPARDGRHQLRHGAGLERGGAPGAGAGRGTPGHPPGSSAGADRARARARSGTEEGEHDRASDLPAWLVVGWAVLGAISTSRWCSSPRPSSRASCAR